MLYLYLGCLYNDILFFIKSLKSPTPAFNIHDYVTFNISTTRSGSFNKLIHNFASTNHTRHFYFNRITRLWNSLPVIDLNLSTSTIKSKLYHYFWTHLYNSLTLIIYIHITIFVRVANARSDLKHFSVNFVTD